MKEFISVSPLKILEKSSQGRLGPGNLGVLVARAGVGKTACLIHIAFDKIFRRGKLVHISLEEGPEKVASYYNVIYSDLLKALNKDDDSEYRFLMERNRMILAYLNQSFDLDRLKTSLKNLGERLDFKPDTLIIDGLDFENADRSLFEGLKAAAEEFQVEIWLSALSHRHINEVNERGIPYPCHKLDDLISIIVRLQPERMGMVLRLLKDHERHGIPENSIALDPGTFLALT
ncbi:MAG: hypothetical protein J7M32_08875 [Deltaproteobacteria bacterium]|nr:hypothetical protein [Deltaproteobacteria bacterium]